MVSLDLDKLKGRLQALRAKTIANGCTEAEALSAAAKLAELLDRHDLSLSDLELREEPCIQSAIETNRKQRQPISACVPAIAEFCDCKVWREKDQTGRIRYVFFGMSASVEMAMSIYEVIAAALQSGWEDYARRQRFIRHSQDEKGSFLFGMAISLADKLITSKHERDDATLRATGRDLVVVRKDVVEAEFSKLNMAFRQGRASGKKVSAEAFDAGHSAGKALDIAFGADRLGGK
jgi:hypothetical protein